MDTEYILCEVSTRNGTQTPKTVIMTLYSIAGLNSHGLANRGCNRNISAGKSHMCWNVREFLGNSNVDGFNKINK